MKNRIEEHIEQAIVEMATDQPAYGQVRVANELIRRGLFASSTGVRSVWLRDREGLGHWIRQLEARTHRNVLLVALANKLARIAWAVLTTGEPHREGAVATG